MAVESINNSKKGMVFTLLAILVLSILTIYYSTGSIKYQIGDDYATKKYQINIGDDLFVSLKDDMLPLIVEISGHRALSSMSEYIYNTSHYYDSNDSFVASFKSVFMDGNNGTQKIDNITGGNHMTNNTFRQRMIDLKKSINETHNMDFRYQIRDVHIFQDPVTGPSNIGVIVYLNYSLHSLSAEWVMNDSFINTTIPITGIYEPVFNIHSMKHEIDFSNRTFDFPFEEVRMHLENMVFIADPNAPSLLMRFYNGSIHNGSLEDYMACCGISALVNPIQFNGSDSLENWSENEINMTYVDHCFWNYNCNLSEPLNYTLYYVSGLTSSVPGDDYYGFKLSPQYLKIYNLTDYRVNPATQFPPQFIP